MNQSTTPEAAMQLIEQTLDQITVGPAVRHRNLAMFPLHGPATAGPAYLTLTEALKMRVARVREISEGGSVPELLFENDADRPVLLVDGEEVVGAKQNRILNVTILAAAHSKTVIPVSCVEAGRWGYDRPDFGSEERVMYSRGRAAKSADVSMCLEDVGMRRSNQGGVWDDISEKMGRLHSHSRSSAMADMYRQRDADVGAFVEAIHGAAGQTGAIFTVNGAVYGMDLFDAGATLEDFLPRLVRSYALDAIDVTEIDETDPAAEVVGDFLKRLAAAPANRFDAVGEGADLRIQAEGIAGGALEHDGRIVHLSAFSLAGTRHGRGGGNEDGVDENEARYLRASMRRRRRVH